MAVNDPPRVHLPGQAFLRNLSVIWPDIEEFEVAFTRPLVVDEDALLDVPSVSVSGKKHESVEFAISMLKMMLFAVDTTGLCRAILQQFLEENATVATTRRDYYPAGSFPICRGCVGYCALLRAPPEEAR